ncbi:MAG: hypothetical protein ACRCST_17190, partial [Turicibacter sp.]
MDSRKLNVTIFFEAEIATTQLIEVVLGTQLFNYEKKLVSAGEGAIANDIDYLPLLIRGADPETVNLARNFVSESKPFVYYIDDNFWEIKGDTPLAKYYQHPIIRDGLKYIVG